MNIGEYSPRRSRGEYLTIIHEPEANNCFSIITQVIIEIHRERNVKFYLSLAVFMLETFKLSRHL